MPSIARAASWVASPAAAIGAAATAAIWFRRCSPLASRANPSAPWAMTEREDVWASGDAYEPYVGRWSRLVAREFLAWLGLPPDLRWLDVGSGTGALSQVILETAAPREVVGVDQSAGYVAYAR